MTQYKYQLDKSSKKFNCPKCGKIRFVQYVETETGHYAESQYGRCDRETNCGYSMYPNNNSILNYEYIAPEPLIPSYIEKEILKKTLTKYEINPLIKINDLSIASSKSDSLDLELRKNGIENAIKKYPQNLTIIISIVK